ncbi:MAG: CHASE2 domain-containing protein [Cytophagales bacterium]|nr:CHASE2 domain-containing protein [Cytophagales bacterium]MDW8384272.1 CHASE2 domain-containing protein [Flammeovirgaceae bacterium]
MFKRFWSYRFLLSFLHAFFLVFLTLWSLSLPFTFGDEATLIQYSATVKRKILPELDKPDRNRFMFVGVTWEKQLIEKVDEKTGLPIGYDVITNRESLGKFLQMLNQNPNNHKFLLIDIFFQNKSPNDSLLAAELKRVKNCVVSYHKDEKGAPMYPIFEAPLGLSDMQTDSWTDMVLKYHLIQGDSLKTTPLVMYEKIYNQQIEHGLFFDKLNGKTIFNSFIIDYRLRNYDLFDADEEKRYPFFYIKDLIELPLEVFAEFTKDKIIIVGDFQGSDTHPTIEGDMAGPLILLNAFLDLEAGDNVLSPFFLVLLFVFYFVISLKIFTPNDVVTQYVESKVKNKLQKGIIHALLDVSVYVFYMGILSIMSYFLFGIHLTILTLSVYMEFLEKFVNWLHEKLLKKNDEMAVG